MRTSILGQLRGPFLWVAVLLTVFSVPGPVSAKRIHPERHYQQAWCSDHKGRAEVRLPDGTRCDCLTADNAVEVEFGDKWAEAIGQALFYSIQTGKRAGVVLILESLEDYRFWIRLNSVIDHYHLPIDTWKVGP